MATTIARLVARIGLLADLPMSPGNYLQPGEFAFAINVGRTFVGNQPIDRSCDGIQDTFSFNGVDLESLQGTYRIWLFANEFDQIGAEQTILTHYSLSNEQVVFNTLPPAGSILRLYYNTELLSTQPDRRYGSAEQRNLDNLAPGPHPASVEISTTLFDTVNIDYVLSATGQRRSGTLRIAASPDNTCTIDDNYTTNSVGADLDIVFSCLIQDGFLKLLYDGATAAVDMSFVVRNWQTV